MVFNFPNVDFKDLKFILDVTPFLKNFFTNLPNFIHLE